MQNFGKWKYILRFVFFRVIFVVFVKITVIIPSRSLSNISWILRISFKMYYLSSISLQDLGNETKPPLSYLRLQKLWFIFLLSHTVYPLFVFLHAPRKKKKDPRGCLSLSSLMPPPAAKHPISPVGRLRYLKATSATLCYVRVRLFARVFPPARHSFGW